MKMKLLALSIVAVSAVASLVACGGNADADKANLDMSQPSHENMSPTVNDGGMTNTNADLAKPANVNESPAPTH